MMGVFIILSGAILMSVFTTYVIFSFTHSKSLLSPELQAEIETGIVDKGIYFGIPLVVVVLIYVILTNVILVNTNTQIMTSIGMIIKIYSIFYSVLATTMVIITCADKDNDNPLSERLIYVIGMLIMSYLSFVVALIVTYF